MNFIKYTRILVLTASVCATYFALADDDEKHESNGHEWASRRSIDTVDDPGYKAECASCHMLYPPGLLPAKSWQAMMHGLKDHFGENASLDKATNERLTELLSNHAADRSTKRRSQKVAQSIAAKDVPLRFTDTLYFKRQHHELGASVWLRKSVGSPANCVACHAKAEQGIFSEDDVKIPK